jgi:chemotaxis protein methyltransferase CheR
MILADIRAARPTFQFRILGTDICTDVLRTARTAIYSEETIDPVPLDVRHRYLLRSIDRRARKIRIGPELRATVDFQRLNFMDEDYGFKLPHDVVFCRNVIIYFNGETRKLVLERICRTLAPGGTLFLGHSETITGIDLPIRQIAPTVYVRL